MYVLSLNCPDLFVQLQIVDGLAQGAKAFVLPAMAHERIHDGCSGCSSERASGLHRCMGAAGMLDPTGLNGSQLLVP